MSAVLRVRGVAVADWPANAPTCLRAALPWLEQGMEREAWGVLTDRSELAAFKAIYGNRLGPLPKRGQPSLFEVPCRDIVNIRTELV